MGQEPNLQCQAPAQELFQMGAQLLPSTPTTNFHPRNSHFWVPQSFRNKNPTTSFPRRQQSTVGVFLFVCFLSDSLYSGLFYYWSQTLVKLHTALQSVNKSIFAVGSCTEQIHPHTPCISPSAKLTISSISWNYLQLILRNRNVAFWYFLSIHWQMETKPKKTPNPTKMQWAVCISETSWTLAKGKHSPLSL